MYAKVEDNKVIAFGALSQILPNVSIPQDADEKKVAKSNGLLEVVQPEFDDFQEKCETCEPYVKNGKVYVYEVKPLSDEEKIEIVNAHVEFELISTAWVESDKDLDKKSLSSWKSYRSSLLKLKGNKDVSELNWPTRPKLELEKVLEEEEIA